MTPPSTGSSPTWGIQWSRKLDPIAALALLLAIAIPVTQWLLSSRARIEYFEDERVLCMLEQPEWSDSKDVVFLFHMNYFNYGDVGYEAVIRAESLQINVGDNTYEYEWWKCVSYDFNNMGEDKSKITINTLDKACPFVVAGKTAEQHNSYFVARPEIEKGRVNLSENVLSAETLLNALRQRDEIEFKVSYETAEQGKKTIRYRLVYDSKNLIDEYINLLQVNNWRTFRLTVLE